MAIDKLINSTQGDSMVAQLTAIKTNLQNLASVSLEKLGMGVAVCDTSASTAAKTATLVNYKLNDGGLIAIKFTNANTASSATLNINNTGAKNIYYKGSAIGTDVIKAGDTAIFMYSTNYHLITIDRWGSEIPKATSTAPAMDTGSTGTVGTSTEYARADHKHPSDSTKQDTVAFYTTYNATTNKAATMTDITNSAQSGTLTGYAKKTGNVSGSDDIATAIGKLETKADNNTSNISSILAREIRKVYVSQNTSSTAHTYKMTFDDFQSPNATVGTYLITIVTWSVTPSFKLYAVSFSGANLDYTTISQIYGEHTITVDSEHNITLTASGKVTIYALR